MTYRNHLFLLAILLISITIVNAQNTVIRKQIKDIRFDARPVSHVDVREISLAPGQAGPLHKHPCPVVGYIISGSALYQAKGQASIILKAGDAFYEPANVVITHFDNASKTEPLHFVINYLMDKEKDFIILLDNKEQPIPAPK